MICLCWILWLIYTTLSAPCLKSCQPLPSLFGILSCAVVLPFLFDLDIGFLRSHVQLLLDIGFELTIDTWAGYPRFVPDLAHNICPPAASYIYLASVLLALTGKYGHVSLRRQADIRSIAQRDLWTVAANQHRGTHFVGFIWNAGMHLGCLWRVWTHRVPFLFAPQSLMTTEILYCSWTCGSRWLDSATSGQGQPHQFC